MWEKIKKVLTNSWMNSVEYLANMAHVGWAALLVLVAAYLSNSDALWTLGAALVLAVFAFVKEYVYDANFEIPKQTTRDNTEDFLGYCLGILISCGIVWVKLRFFS